MFSHRKSVVQVRQDSVLQHGVNHGRITRDRYSRQPQLTRRCKRRQNDAMLLDSLDEGRNLTLHDRPQQLSLAQRRDDRPINERLRERQEGYWILQTGQLRPHCGIGYHFPPHLAKDHMWPWTNGRRHTLTQRRRHLGIRVTTR